MRIFLISEEEKMPLSSQWSELRIVFVVDGILFSLKRGMSAIYTSVVRKCQPGPRLQKPV